MISSIKDYLKQLDKALKGSDRAVIQDAIADAEEYLNNAMAEVKLKNPGINEEAAIPGILDTYGTPVEVAAAYRKAEFETSTNIKIADNTSNFMETDNEAPIALQPKNIAPGKWYYLFFKIIADRKAWGSLLYLFLSLPLGIIYFTWAVTGFSLSSGLLVLIIGIPFSFLFILSLRGLALIEGRLVEVLMGIRMPRRTTYLNRNIGLFTRIKILLRDKYSWLSFIYMIIYMPLSIFYFVLLVISLVISFCLMAAPVLAYMFEEKSFAFMQFGGSGYYHLQSWSWPFCIIAGILVLFCTLHLAKALGKMHGSISKAMLVRPYK